MARQVIYPHDDATTAGLVAWAAERIFPPECSGAFRPDAKAIAQRGASGPVAVVVFDNWSRCDCNMHVASDGTSRWLTREYLIRCFAYPFIQCGLRRVTGMVPARNAAALRFDLHLGFRPEGRCRQALPDDDIVILGMLRQECRWIPKEYRRA